jgi:alpha-glucuronidase
MIFFVSFVAYACAAPPAASPWMSADYFNPVWSTPRLPDGTRDKAWLARANHAGLSLNRTDLIGNGSLTPGVAWKATPDSSIRMVNHWDNFDGSIERGYAWRSVFFEDGKFRKDWKLVEEYAQILASVRINAISINNVNVREGANWFITNQRGDLDNIRIINDIFRRYGIKTFIAINFAAPRVIGNLTTFDPLNESVISFWRNCTDQIYRTIPDFGGFVVKADAEGEPGPLQYGRSHSDGANLFGRLLRPYGGLCIWRCFVYNYRQDWRDRRTDRAKAAYEIFAPLDGTFADNVVLQIKNGPIDFQIKEPVSPLIGALRHTNQILEFQITQEYLGQQQHVVFLASLWSEVLNWRTYVRGLQSDRVADVIRLTSPNQSLSGIAGVGNVGLDLNWAGHKLAQANLYAFGRLCWDSALTPEQIAREWVELTFYNLSADDKESIVHLLTTSRDTYRAYTVPLGLGLCMCKPKFHYGPDIDGYEYDKWGAYHFADRDGLGPDRTAATGSGYTAQYAEEIALMYENIETCPDDDLLFFHRVNYTHRLHNNKTVVQHIYDEHFDGVKRVEEYQTAWNALRGKIEERDFLNVQARMTEQLNCARQWRDIVNTYFYRHSGVPDAKAGQSDRIIYA